MISTGTRGGGGERNVALEQLQSYICPSWICLSPLACVQPAKNICQLEYLPVVILAHSYAMLSSRPASFPSRAAWTPRSSPTCSG